MMKNLEYTRDTALLNQQIDYLNKKNEETNKIIEDNQKRYEEKLFSLRNEVEKDLNEKFERLKKEKNEVENKLFEDMEQMFLSKYNFNNIPKKPKGDENVEEKIIEKVKEVAKQPVIMKLSPNVTDIVEMAKAAERGGADALSLINTITGMKIDIEKQDFVLANKTGGLSGPAIHPVAVRMVYQVANAVDLPIIGMGGIQTAEDAIEMILAGATMVSVGTANFYNPNATMEVVKGIEDYMIKHNVSDIKDLVGKVK